MSHNCYICNGFLKEFHQNYDYVEILGEMREVHETCLKESGIYYKTLQQRQKMEVLVFGLLRGFEKRIKRVYVAGYGWYEMT